MLESLRCADLWLLSVVLALYLQTEDDFLLPSFAGAGTQGYPLLPPIFLDFILSSANFSLLNQVKAHSFLPSKAVVYIVLCYDPCSGQCLNLVLCCSGADWEALCVGYKYR